MSSVIQQLMSYRVSLPPTIQTTSSGGQDAATVTHPITMPTGITTGDVLIVIFAMDDNTGTPNPVAVGTGWTRDVNINQVADFTGCAIFTKVASGVDSLTVTTAGNSVKSEHIVYRISGAQYPPYYATASNLTNDPANLAPAPGNRNYLWIVGVALGDNRALTVASSGYSNIINPNVVTTATIAAGSFSRILQASSENPGTYTTIGAGNDLIVTIAVNPV